MLESDGRIQKEGGLQNRWYLKKKNLIIAAAKVYKSAGNSIRAKHNDATGTNGQLLLCRCDRSDTCPPGIPDIIFSVCLEMLHVAERAVRGRFNETSAGKEGHGEERDERFCQNRNFASTRRQLIKDLRDSAWL